MDSRRGSHRQALAVDESADPSLTIIRAVVTHPRLMYSREQIRPHEFGSAVAGVRARKTVGKIVSKADALEIYRQGFGAIAPRLRPR